MDAHATVLDARAAGLDRASTVLVPIDFSEASRHALAAALSLVEGAGSATEEGATTVLAVHVLDQTRIDFIAELGYAQPEEIAAKARAHAEQRLKRLTDLELPPGVELTRVVVAGSPVAELLKLARELSADLMVLGIPPLFVGSPAEKIILGAPCPVLLVKGGPEEAELPAHPTDEPSGAPGTV